MKSYEMFDEDALCDEILKHYLEPEYYMATKRSLPCVTTKKTATTLDEYVKLLAEGYINVEIREELDQYVDVLLENEWFHQWPVVYWMYIHRAYDRKVYAPYKKDYVAESVEAEIKILNALAKEGWPGALADVGRCSNRIPGKDFERRICMWIYAYRRGYLTAGGYLFAYLRSAEYEQLCDELKMFMLDGAVGWFLDNNGATESNYKETLSGWPLKRTRELLNQSKCMRALVVEKVMMRDTAGRLFWPEGESPYEIQY